MDYSKKKPNALGIPMKKKESAKIQASHNKWKAKVKELKCDDYSKMAYWQKQCTNTIL